VGASADDPGTQNFYGRSVSIDGDTILVGAEGADADAGRVYVYARSGSLWTEQTVLTPDSGETNVGFGWAVSMSGDTAAIGTSAQLNMSNVAGQTGAVYVFVRVPGTNLWSLQQLLPAVTTHSGFSRDVCVSADTLLVSSSTGSVVTCSVFDQTSTTWTLVEDVSFAGIGVPEVSIDSTTNVFAVGSMRDGIIKLYERVNGGAALLIDTFTETMDLNDYIS
jgi:hypothetical protein